MRWFRSHSNIPRTHTEGLLKGDSYLTYAIRVEDKAFDVIVISLSGKIFVDNAELLRRDLVRIIESGSLKNVVIDLAKVEYFDSSGVAVLMEMFRICERLNNSFKLANVPPGIQSLVELVDFKDVTNAHVLQPRSEPSLIIQMGEGAQNVYNTGRDILVFIGGSVEALIKDLTNPGKLRWDSLSKLIERCGTDAVPIVAILSFLMGGILAFQAAIQLRKFGANIFVADLVGLSIVLEMGPLITSLIVSGRSGAAFAAQIGTMQVTEEIDALRVMGIDPIRYLVSPRIVAVALTVPCLTLIGDLVGIVGGCLVAQLSLDLTPTAYFNQLHKVLELSDVVKGLIKSFVFGVEIAMIGCLRGFQVRGGAENVGSATTSAVVTCIFVLTVTDALFSMLFHYSPPVWKS
jgi:phospholipid/cholesterol/gamma-HCH transport system permease protein